MRVVSLVPSLTEAVAVSAPQVLVGATDWCTHPAGLDVPRVGGSKYPDLARVLALRPDLVLLNVEENRRADAEALAAAGVPVRVTYPRTVPQALTELADLLAALGVTGEPEWLATARRAWAALPGDRPAADLRRAVVPVWRRPWVVLGSDTFAGDVLRRLGVVNLYAGHAERYPRPDLADLRAQRPDLVVLPDEPYRFTGDDGPEAFAGTPCALLSGRHLTWYGPSLARAPAVLAAQLARPVTVPGG
ncbi:cobalamin-binding protein [Micromonospora rosaria]|uniref:Cobalamin-binding protein n=1 Tax=Micromonospora rosaria TaxID=47874 RepID=A0A136PJV0_9ACTN|nr:helical backbone metal receptor [Micromonospora rosaria]KXK58679.1 cobalamin-binding protein [Micromonospora rosaria]